MRLFPGSMTGRIFLILLLGILASIALTFWLAFGERQRAIGQASSNYKQEDLISMIRSCRHCS